MENDLHGELEAHQEVGREGSNLGALDGEVGGEEGWRNERRTGVAINATEM